MSQSINLNNLAEVILSGSSTRVVLIADNVKIICGLENILGEYKRLDRLENVQILNLIGKEICDQLKSNSSVHFVGKLDSLHLNTLIGKELDIHIIKLDSYFIFKISPSVANVVEILPRVNFFVNMVKTHFEDFSHLSNTVVGGVIESESKELSKELENILLD